MGDVSDRLDEFLQLIAGRTNCEIQHALTVATATARPTTTTEENVMGLFDRIRADSLEAEATSWDRRGNSHERAGRDTSSVRARDIADELREKAGELRTKGK